mmetsp:Transcript_45182/g.63227  ORF Transcript_45182/g.63227 Transcript_45182/m.63227 type:complete len:97 (+) Transcript_45182:730-1020(+)
MNVIRSSVFLTGKIQQGMQTKGRSNWRATSISGSVASSGCNPTIKHFCLVKSKKKEGRGINTLNSGLFGLGNLIKKRRNFYRFLKRQIDVPQRKYE